MRRYEMMVILDPQLEYFVIPFSWHRDILDHKDISDTLLTCQEQQQGLEPGFLPDTDHLWEFLRY